MRKLFHLLAVIFVTAHTCAADDVGILENADVVFLGEVHDNPAHHARQADLVAALRPAALVFEMLTDAQADLITPDMMTDPDVLAAAVDWANSGWPDFAMYAPIFSAAPDAVVYGAQVPRDQTRKAAFEGVETVFPEVEKYGLDTALPAAEQQAREDLQLAAHCNTMPADMLPVMVDIQRLRDAALAHGVDRALALGQTPVVVITGNGHARTDWGAPRILRDIHPQLTISALGQGETGFGIEGQFDLVEMSPAAERDDPCAAFLESRKD